MAPLLLVWLSLVGWPPVAVLQHPCDSVYPTVYREPTAQLANLKVGFCFVRADTEGVALTEAVAFSLQVNMGPEIDLGELKPLTAPNAAGAAYYEFSNAALAAGTITIKASTVQLGESAPSAPITLTLLGSPTKPTNTTIKK
jgi:hypothetical protein